MTNADSIVYQGFHFMYLDNRYAIIIVPIVSTAANPKILTEWIPFLGLPKMSLYLQSIIYYSKT